VYVKIAIFDCYLSSYGQLDTGQVIDVQLLTKDNKISFIFSVFFFILSVFKNYKSLSES
jgi:hypothetical protein